MINKYKFEGPELELVNFSEILDVLEFTYSYFPVLYLLVPLNFACLH